jgi:hypothetical protein
MYNIAKVAKGEILLYFNDIFDALCKVSSWSCDVPYSEINGFSPFSSLPTRNCLLKMAQNFLIG